MSYNILNPSRTVVTDVWEHLQTRSPVNMALPHEPQLLGTADDKEKRNWSSSGLYCLPDELLVKIMRMWQDDCIRQLYDWTDQLANDSHNPQLTWWGPQLGCCRRFRDISLKNPELWSTIILGYDVRHPLDAWINTCLKYAAEHPMTLHAFFQTGVNRTQILGDLERLKARIHKLYLYLGQSSSIESLIIESALPHIRVFHDSLEQAHIHTGLTYVNVKTGTGAYQPVLGITSSLFGGSMDTLTSLHLEGKWRFTQAYPAFPRLTHLTIEDLSSFRDPSTQLNEWLEYLPSLAMLDVTFTQLIMPGLSPLATHPQESLDLSALRSVVLRGYPTQLATALARLPNPQKLLHLEIRDMPTDTEWDQQARSSVFSHISRYWDERVVSSIAPMDHMLHVDSAELDFLVIDWDSEDATDRNDCLPYTDIFLSPMASGLSAKRGLRLEGRLSDEALSRFAIKLASTLVFSVHDAVGPICSAIMDLPLSSIKHIVINEKWLVWGRSTSERLSEPCSTCASPHAERLMQLMKDTGNSLDTVIVYLNQSSNWPSEKDRESIDHLGRRWVCNELCKEFQLTCKDEMSHWLEK